MISNLSVVELEQLSASHDLALVVQVQRGDC
jgi:hypothetical protein